MQSHKSSGEAMVSSSSSANSEMQPRELDPVDDAASGPVKRQDAEDYIIDMVLELRDMARAIGQFGISDALGRIHCEFGKTKAE